MNQVIKNCGNFSAEILPGMIRYPQETGKGHGKADANEDMPHGDGYATKEGDIQLGGFIHRRAAQEAALQGERLHTMSLEGKQKIALKVCQNHIAQHGEIGPEYFRRWMQRTRGYAGHHKIQLPPKNDREGDYDYFRRLRRWTLSRNENWPALRKAVGTHLVFSPDPKMWETVRDAGMDERHFPQSILLRTMKDFSDWRRQLKKVTPTFSQAQLNAIRNPSPHLRKFAHRLRGVAYAMRSIYGFKATSPQSEFGAMMRIIVAIGRLSQERQQEAYGKIREVSLRYKTMARGVSQENELEPGD